MARASRLVRRKNLFGNRFPPNCMVTAKISRRRGILIRVTLIDRIMQWEDARAIFWAAKPLLHDFIGN